jgi:uncharacterized protein (DUF1499 family)
VKRYLPLFLAILALVMLLASGLGTRAGFWTFRTGFSILKYAAYLGMAAMLLSVVALAWPRWRGGHATPFIIAFVMAAFVVNVPWSFQRKARSVPPIHDISTDTERPPEFVAVLPARADAANPPEYAGAETAAQQHEAYPDVKPVLLNEPPPAAFRAAHAAAEAMGWEIVAADSAAGRIEATATTTWFGFKDDVVIRVEPADQGSRIDVRSKSRVGRGDVGANAARIRKYTRRLSTE